MLPAILPFSAWESDATMRAAIEQSVTNTVSELGEFAVLSGGDLTLDARTYDPAAQYTALVHGFYARLFNIAPSAGIGLPADNVEADADFTGAWQLGPLSRLNLDVRGYMATELGVRAFDELAARDPFLQNRLEYTLADTLTYSTVVTKRTSLTVTGQYVQMGALWAQNSTATGVDMHEGLADAMYNIEVTPIDVLSPEVPYTAAHYYHALLDLQLDRGPADIQTGSLLLGVTHPFGRALTVTLTGGATIATAPPVLQDKTPVLSPEARVFATYSEKRWRAMLSYAYTYASLGPAIGYGKEHTGSLEIAWRPVDGAAYRDMMLHAIFRGSAGSSPISADPVAANEPGAPPPQAIVYSQSAAAGAILEYPLRKHFSLVTGVDFELTNATFSPASPSGSPGLSFNLVALVGVAWTVSTDPLRTVRRDPEDEAEDARRATEIRLHPVYQETTPPVWDLRDTPFVEGEPGSVIPAADDDARDPRAPPPPYDPRHDERDPNVSAPAAPGSATPQAPFVPPVPPPLH